MNVPELASALGITRQQVYRCHRLGMPIDSVAAAVAWRETNLDPSQRKGGRIDRPAAPAAASPDKPPTTARMDLQQERARESRMRADWIAMQMRLKAETHYPAEYVAREWNRLIIETRTALMQIPERLVSEIRVLHDVVVDPALIESHIETALHRLAAADNAESSIA